MEKKHFNKLYIVLLIIIVLIIFFVIYKNSYLKKYNSTSEIYNMNSSTYTIEETKTDRNIYYNDVSIRDIFDKYYFDEDYNKYFLYDSEGNFLESYSVSIGDTYYDIFLNGYNKYYNGKDDIFNYDELSKILEKNNIKSDSDLITFLFDNVNNKSNIFTSFKNIKLNYYIKEFVKNAFPLINNFDLIDGYVDGFIIYDNNSEEGENINVNIYTETDRYVLTFNGSELSVNDIVDLLGTVVIG